MCLCSVHTQGVPSYLVTWAWFTFCAVLYQGALGSAEHPGRYKSKYTKHKVSSTWQSKETLGRRKFLFGGESVQQSSITLQPWLSSRAEDIHLMPSWSSATEQSLEFYCIQLELLLSSLKTRGLQQAILLETELMETGLLHEFISWGNCLWWYTLELRLLGCWEGEILWGFSDI